VHLRGPPGPGPAAASHPGRAADHHGRQHPGVRPPGECLRREGPFFLFFSDDPERSAHQLGRYVQHEMQEYAAWHAASDHFVTTHDIPLESVWQVGSHQVLTPGAAVELIRGFPPGSLLLLHPLCGGLPPDLGHESLRLFVERVLPELGREPDVTVFAADGGA
jgi:hypothetical protein